MKPFALLLIVLLPAHAGCADTPENLQDGYLSKVWSPDQGDGTYKNPVLYADYSDPDVCAVGNNYYLTASSFNCIPGLPILHSKDLVNWEIIGHALNELEPKEVFDSPQHGKGVWAPSIRYHNGTFYIYWGDPDYGVFVVTAKDPAGEWTKPHCVIAGKGMIDTCPLWDEDGRCYLVNGWAGSRAGFNSVLSVRELSADGMNPIGLPHLVFDGGEENHTTEGPKFYKRDGWYWIMCPAGGVKEGWQLAMRSRNPYGPYEWRNVMDRGSTDVHGPHQGGWVHTPEGEDWFLHFNDKYAYGRVVFLQPMKWIDGWPVIGADEDGDGKGEPVMEYTKPKNSGTRLVNPQESDEFENSLGLQWQWHANYRQEYGMPTPYGFYRMYSYDLDSDNLWEAPNLLLQKIPAPSFTATSKMRIAAKCEHEYGGLIMMGMAYEALVAERIGDEFQLKILQNENAFKGGNHRETIIATLAPTESDKGEYHPAIYLDIYIQIQVADSKCSFAWSTDGKTYNAAPGSFEMKAGRWIGAKMGFVSESKNRTANRGWVDAFWFRVE